MASTTTNAYGARLHGGPRGMLERLGRRYADYRLYRQTLKELEALGDRELKDLGLMRQGVRQVARESVYGG